MTDATSPASDAAPGLRLPEFEIPRPLGAIVARLPQFPPSFALVAALNLVPQRVLSRDALEPLMGRVLCLRVTDAGLTLRFTLTPGGFRTAADGADSDLTISASARDFIALALRREDPDALFFDRRLMMEGDTELGLIVKNTLDATELPPVPAALRALASILQHKR
jgi:predicted lipid carrier protein YhbT